MSNNTNPRNADFVMCFKTAKYLEDPNYKTFMKSILKNTKKTNGKVHFSFLVLDKLYDQKKLMSVKETYAQIDKVCNTCDVMDDNMKRCVITYYAETN